MQCAELVNWGRYPGVKLILVNTDDQIVNVQDSDAKGDFAFEGIKSGTYTLIAEATHFDKLVVKKINVTDTKVISVRLIMEVSDVEVMVGIIGDAPMIDIRSSGITKTITRRQIESLPRP